MRIINIIIMVLPLFFISCMSFHGGSFEGCSESSNKVSLDELNRYYELSSGGKIKLVKERRSEVDPNLMFEWDPFFKKRILPLGNVEMRDLQNLFSYDVKKMVDEEGTIDFCSAKKKHYEKYPFNESKQTHERPYRYLNAWGSLFFPPIKKLSYPLSFYHSRFTDDYDTRKVKSKYFDPQFQKQLDRETQTELTYGNKLTALFNGIESYPAKKKLIDSAESFLYVAVMTIVSDQTGRELIKKMVNAKRRGVDVRLITEGFYTFSLSNYCVGILEREGIPVVRVDDKTLSNLDRMFHDKMWIRDGKQAILGGMNILNYENRADGFNFLNRDTDVLIEGPAVTSLLQSYVNLWKKYDTQLRPIALGEYTLATNLEKERRQAVRGSEHYAEWLLNPDRRMNGICRTAVQGNNAEPQKIVMLLLRYLEAAEHSAYITSPEIEFETEHAREFHDMLAKLMIEKSKNPDFYTAYITNGFDGGLGEKSIFLRQSVYDAILVGEHFWVDMLTPLIDQDGRDVNRRVRQTIMPMIEAGVHGFQYFNYIHCKEFYFDRLMVGIGSWNFDGFSANNNHECAIFCLDESLRKQVEKQFVLDMVNSVPVIPFIKN